MNELEHLREDLQPYVARGELAYAGNYIDENFGRAADIAHVLNVRGMAALEGGDVALARCAFEAAAALAPRDAAYCSNLGFACIRQKDYGAAATALRNAVRLDPQAESARLHLKAIEDGFGRPPSTLYAFYDLATSPVTFDFVLFLALAELDRRRRGVEVLRIIFVPGPNDGFRNRTTRDRTFERGRKEWRLHNILVPACRLVAAAVEPALCTSREEALKFETLAEGTVFPSGYRVEAPTGDYHLGKLLTIASQGLEVRVLEVPRQAVALIRQWLDRRAQGRPVIAITLRESDFEPERNSDLASWAQVACWVAERGFFPVVVPDTEALIAGTSCWAGTGTLCPAAALNLELRAALYAESFLNLMVAGGYGNLCRLSATARYLTFMRVLENLHIWSVEGHLRNGLQPGEQLGFAGDFQRIGWTGDGFESVIGELEPMLARMPQRPLGPDARFGAAAGET